MFSLPLPSFLLNKETMSEKNLFYEKKLGHFFFSHSEILGALGLTFNKSVPVQLYCSSSVSVLQSMGITHLPLSAPTR